MVILWPYFRPLMKVLRCMHCMKRHTAFSILHDVVLFVKHFAVNLPVIDSYVLALLYVEFVYVK